jgi:hypothetical protein
VRESDLFLIPLAYAVWARSLVDPKALRSVAAVGLPAILVYVSLRLAIPTVGRESVPGYSGAFFDARLDVLERGLEEWKVEGRRLLTAFGPLWLLAPLALRTLSFARRGLVLVALAVGSMTYALDWGRMILLALPVFYVAGAVVAGRRRYLAAGVLAGFLLLNTVYAVHMQRSGVRNIEETSAPPYPVQ